MTKKSSKLLYASSGVVSVNQVLAVSISSIKALEDQIKTLDKAIAEQMELISNTLMSIKGIGPVFAGGIIGRDRRC